MTPLMAAFARDQNFETILIHTGQHYDNINEQPFGLVMLHRPANVYDEGKLSEIVNALRVISEELPLYWPVRPPTRASFAAPLGRQRRARSHVATKRFYAGRGAEQ